MHILGINAYHGDASAAILCDGQLVAAVEEERFNRIKHWAGFPTQAIRYCLQTAGVRLEELDHVAISRDPKANLHRKILYAVSKGPSTQMVKDRLANAARVGDVRAALAQGFAIPVERVRAEQHRVEHHRAHMASAFFASPFDQAACLSIDGFGDFLSVMWGQGQGNSIKVLGRVLFPHSLGIFYTAVTQYLGFMKYGDEYKVMGLASFGEPEYLDAFRQIVRLDRKGFRLDLDYFLHHSDGVAMTWDDGEPHIGRIYSDEFMKRLGPAREPGTPLERRHENLAASLQALTEEVYFHILNQLHEATGLRRLCLAGGVAFNSVANGKILSRTPFDEIYIQAAAGDAGTALGAALGVWHSTLGKPRGFVMQHAYWGPEFSHEQIRQEVERCRKMENGEWKMENGRGRMEGGGWRMENGRGRMEGGGWRMENGRGRMEGGGWRMENGRGRMEDGEWKMENGGRISEFGEDELVRETARHIAEGKVVGWFQGRMEWGPRALGNRSILADPRRAEMKDVLNARIKRREPFRPFCPSILAEDVNDYFEGAYPDPFMITVYPIKPEKRAVIPAVTHIDGTGRLQSVTREENPLYWKLIQSFKQLTGVPVVLNTSFNENEPIVHTPAQALDCFLRTKMDVLAIGPYLIEKG